MRIKLSEIFKIALKKIKSLFNLQTEKIAECPSESEEPNETPRDGSEEHTEEASKKLTI